MEKQRSLVSSILTQKCPRCHKGDMFPKGTLYTPKFADMHQYCACCGQDLEPEPGYYFGAMYVSFGISTGIFLVVFFFLNLLVEEITLTMIMTMVVVIVIGFLPITFRVSRAIWINIFENYEGPCNQIPKHDLPRRK